MRSATRVNSAATTRASSVGRPQQIRATRGVRVDLDRDHRAIHRSLERMHCDNDTLAGSTEMAVECSIRDARAGGDRDDAGAVVVVIADPVSYTHLTLPT